MNGTLLYITEVAPYDSEAGKPPRLAGVHRVLQQSTTALAEMADVAGLNFLHSDDVRSLPPDALDSCRVLALFTIGETRWSKVQKRQILDRVRAGETHLLAMHSATDSCHLWDDFGRLIGARFAGHPWTQEFEIEVTDHEHPATRHLPDPWLFEDEIYLFRDLRPDARVLLRLRPDGLDMSRPDAQTPGIGYPLAWTFTEGLGRIFYTSLGHFPEAYENITYLDHLYGALKWLLDEKSAAA
jgi:type 1 glutamine amidotransferase